MVSTSRSCRRLPLWTGCDAENRAACLRAPGERWGEVGKGGDGGGGWAATSRPSSTQCILFLGLKLCSALYILLVLSIYSVSAGPEGLWGNPTPGSWGGASFPY